MDVPRRIDGLRALIGRVAHDWLHRVGTGLLVTTCVACMAPADEPDTGTLEADSTVGDHVGSGCSTAVVLGLSQQIADEVACERPGAFAHFAAGGGISFSGSAVLSYLAPDARDGLEAAAAGGGSMSLTSAYRTVAQQYLLYQWYAQGRCGITAAATPGNSNHESGRAVDLGNYGSYVSRMSAHGWAHDVAGDPVHFDHLASADLRGSDVLAFQRLWNRNNPNDPIAEDGAYGPQTGARIARSPSGGFAKGPTCGTTARALVAKVMTSPGPLAPGQAGMFTIELTNTGDVAWPAATTIVTAPDGRDSALYDASHWTSAHQIAAIGQDVAPGASLDVDVAVVAPASDVVTHVDEAFALDDGAGSFGAIALTVQVVPVGDSPSDDTAPEGPEGDDGGPVVTGGCSAGGDGAGALLLLAPLALLWRRRRRS